MHLRCAIPSTLVVKKQNAFHNGSNAQTLQVLQMSQVKAKGHRLQDELYRWYLLVFRENTCGSAQNLVPGLNALRHHVEVLIKDGWQLAMSADNSPADKAGVDFIWENPSRGWFPLDAKAMGQTSCRLISHVHVGNNTDAGEYKQLRHEDKLAFLEQLVKLARTGRPVSHSCCLPPGVTAMSSAQLLEELKKLQKQLATSASCDERLGEWSVALGKAIGYLNAQKRGGASEEATKTAQKTIASAIDAFFGLYFNGNNTIFASQCMRLQPALRRSDRLQYQVTGDIIKATVGNAHELVVLSGLAALIKKRFEARYLELVDKHRSADWLIQRKRTFETKGVECVIHAVLDAFQRQASARRGVG